MRVEIVRIFFIFSIISLFLYPSLWQTAWERRNYCLKEPINPKLPTNQIFMLWYLFWMARSILIWVCDLLNLPSWCNLDIFCKTHINYYSNYNFDAVACRFGTYSLHGRIILSYISCETPPDNRDTVTWCDAMPHETALAQMLSGNAFRNELCFIYWRWL